MMPKGRLKKVRLENQRLCDLVANQRKRWDDLVKSNATMPTREEDALMYDLWKAYDAMEFWGNRANDSVVKLMRMNGMEKKMEGGAE